MESKWRFDAHKLLEVTNDQTSTITCVGYAPSRGRRCQRALARHNVEAAHSICKKLSDGVPKQKEREGLLQDLSERLLCPKDHKGQKSAVSQRWILLVQVEVRKRQERLARETVLRQEAEWHQLMVAQAEVAEREDSGYFSGGDTELSDVSVMEAELLVEELPSAPESLDLPSLPIHNVVVEELPLVQVHDVALKNKELIASSGEAVAADRQEVVLEPSCSESISLRDLIASSSDEHESLPTVDEKQLAGGRKEAMLGVEEVTTARAMSEPAKSTQVMKDDAGSRVSDNLFAISAAKATSPQRGKGSSAETHSARQEEWEDVINQEPWCVMATILCSLYTAAC